MWAHPQQPAYPAEHFGIYVSTTNTDISSFTLLDEWTLSSGDWKQFSVDLRLYTGQTGYIAVRHFNGMDQFYINVDDFVLDTDAAITIEMPVTITPATVYVRMKDNLSAGIYSGTLTGAAGTFNGSVNLSGEVIYPTFTLEIIGHNNPGGGWNLIASPLAADVTPTEANGFLANSYDLYRFNQSKEYEWENYKVHGFGLESGRGYLYANSQNVTLTFTGTPYSGNGEVTLTRDVNAEFPGMNLVGNPFPVVAYLPSGHSFYTMRSDNMGLVATTNNSVQAMEGIFVEALSDGEILTFTTTAPSKKGAMVSLNVSRGCGEFIDRAIVRFGEGSTLSKFQLDRNSTKVYIPQDGKDYAVVYSEGIGEVPVNFKAGENGAYTLGINAEEVEFNYLHLIDNMTGRDVDLLQTPGYSFEASVTDYESRFRLVFATGTADNSDSFAFYSNGSWIIGNEGEATLQVIDVTGRILSSETVNGSVSKTINAASGVYMLRLINGDNVKVQKIVVR